MKKTLLIVIVVIITLYAMCLTYIVFIHDEKPQVTNQETLEENKVIMELQHRIVQYGDTDAYNYLITEYGSDNNLIYSIFMADKYGYPNACYNVYSDIAGVMYAYNKIAPNSIVSNLVLSCLYRGKDDKDCLMELGMLYTTGFVVPQDTVKGRYYTELAFSGEGKEYVDRLMKLYMTSKMFDLPQAYLDDPKKTLDEVISSRGKNSK